MAGCSQERFGCAKQGIAAAVLVFACLAPGTAAMAATASGSLQVRATVIAACRVPLTWQELRDGTAFHGCQPAPEISRYVPPPPRILPPKDRGEGAHILVMEF